MKILVTAAAGHQGKLLIPKLSAAGHRVRAARKSPGREAELEALGAEEVVAGDLADVETYCQALDGCDAVYHIGPGGILRERDSGLAMIEAARRCGTRHVVLSSALYTNVDIIQHRYKGDIEEKLAESGLNWTVLKPTNFMMTEVHIYPVLKTGKLPEWRQTPPGWRENLIDVEDIAEAAATVLSEGERHYYANYDLCGPDRLTADQTARILSRLLGREISLVYWSPDDMLAFFGADETPTPESKHQSDVFRSIARWYSQHEFVGNPNTLEWLLGRRGTGFEEWARRTLKALDAI
ncbi:SDR family oxidoreductase [Mycobacterium aquaticum]|uniref:NmrA-like domain-containing protein n=1 Tax=Mycobacterium aquaticum TaxID=1927124 RepID=A0A1X0A8P3_9MYCO|nr:NAD(P)H-binding protein [Mycobacterium aquaticum]ORA26285.1 hypothetical protein BST13_32005 [Mycobacterium aquaticum]